MLGIYAIISVLVAFVAQDRPRLDLRGHRGAIGAVAFEPGDAQIASFSSEGNVHIWDLESGRALRELTPRGHVVDATQSNRGNTPRRVESIAYYPSGPALAEASDDGEIRVWNPDDGSLKQTLASGVKGLRAVAVTSDGKIVANNQSDAGSLGHVIVLRNAATGEKIAELSSARLAATSLAFSPDGATLASAGGKKLNFWSVADKKALHEISAHDGAIQGIAFFPDGKRLASCGSDDHIKIWDVETGKMIREIEADQDGVLSVAVSPSGRTVASGGGDNRVRLWDPDSGKRFKTLWGHADKVTTVAFSANGKMLASGSRDSTVAVWDFSEPEKPTFEKVEEKKDKDKKK